MYFKFDGKTVLDFGSGTGANCLMFHPDQYIGVDPDAERINFAKRAYPKHRFQVSNKDELPLDNRCIDKILIIAVLHHVSSPEITAYLKEFKRVLKPAGKIIVMEPCLCEKKPMCNKFMNWYDDGDYIRNEKQYLKLFRDNGYECQVLKRFRKCLLYNELFFSAQLEPVHQVEEADMLFPAVQESVPEYTWS